MTVVLQLKGAINIDSWINVDTSSTVHKGCNIDSWTIFDGIVHEEMEMQTRLQSRT